VSHVYCSPFLAAAPGSAHGYAVVDPRRVDDRLGGEDGRSRLVTTASAHGLGVVVDLVPNHMAVSVPDNRWLWDVLENGRSSRYAGHFDLDWDPPGSSTRNQVIMPILEDHYGRELEAGAITLKRAGERVDVRYHDHVLPASPPSVEALLQRAAPRTGSDNRPGMADTSDVARLMESPDIRIALDTVLREINSDPDALDEVLELQNYRLARWSVTDQELGYRRFFDIDSLIGVRVEEPEVFADTHELILGWVTDGEADGLRIDHPDGLWNPGRYLTRLREAAPRSWIVVEKILERDETLPRSWPVDGTTGYDFLNDVTTLLVDPQGEAPLTELWNDLTASTESWDEVVDQAKRQVVEHVLAAELNRLTALFADLVADRRRYRDFTRAELSEALAETAIGFDVYRTYVTETGRLDPADRNHIAVAVGRARKGSDLDPELLDLIEQILTAELDGEVETELRMRFQQFTGPVMAKGVEDTAFYRYLRLAALCEVGGDPGRFGYDDVGEFHRRRRRSSEQYPATMLALTTHDTKRSEDVRARLAVLSEIPEQWAGTVWRWRSHNQRHRPDRLDGATEYLIYQTLVGAHPLDVERLVQYLEKATKEAKTHTSWTDPDPEYDRAVADFARAIDADEEFGDELEGFVGRIIESGRRNSLTQKTIQLTAPGIPDIYQGSELWDLRLVDPDNRRPVDHDIRRRLLAELTATPMGAADVMGRMDEGLPKLSVVHALLNLRRRRAAALGPDGAYTPLLVGGDAARHAVAYRRGGEVVVIVPRLTLRLAETGGWSDTHLELPPGQWTDIFTGTEHRGQVEVATLLAGFPVAVLETR